MLAKFPIGVVIPAMDYEKSKKFYAETLGLKLVTEFPGGALFEAGKGSQMMLYQRPEKTKAEHTVAGFTVDNLEQEMEELRAKGVVFEEYNMPEMGIKTTNGLAEMGDQKSAWFKDPDGNILALSQQP